MATEMVDEVTEDVTDTATGNIEAAFQTSKPRIARRHSYGNVMMNDHIDFESVFNQILTSSCESAHSFFSEKKNPKLKVPFLFNQFFGSIKKTINFM